MREEYERLFSAIVDAAEPADAIAWLFTRDIADLSWEIRRERAVKAQVIAAARNVVVKKKLTPIAVESGATGQAVGEFARQVAEAELDILRIRKIKASVFVSVADPASRSEAYAELNSSLAKLERYERRALSRRKRALRAINSCGRTIATKQKPSDNHD